MSMLTLAIVIAGYEATMLIVCVIVSAYLPDEFSVEFGRRAATRDKL